MQEVEAAAEGGMAVAEAAASLEEGRVASRPTNRGTRGTDSVATGTCLRWKQAARMHWQAWQRLESHENQ